MHFRCFFGQSVVVGDESVYFVCIPTLPQPLFIFHLTFIMITPPGPIVGLQSIPQTPVLVVGCTSGAINFYSWHDWDLVQDNVIQDTTLDGFVCLDTSTVVWSGPRVWLTPSSYFYFSFTSIFPRSGVCV